MDFVPYSKFIDLEPRLKVNRFLEIRTLYVLDEFWDVTDEEICEKLYVEPAQLAALRANPHYPTVGAAIQAAAAGLAAAKTLDEWAEAVEDQTAAELWMIGSGDGLARDRVAALTAFADRRSAKKGREPDPAPPISLPPGFVESIMWVMKQREVTGAIVGDVDGGVLNVPGVQKRVGPKPSVAEEN